MEPTIELRKSALMLRIPEAIVTEYIASSGITIKDIIPEKCLECRKMRDGEDGSEFHITILNTKERKQNPSIRATPVDEMGLDTKFTIIGLGSVRDECYYLIVHYPAGDLLRKRLKLPEKDFHITLGFMGSDVHDVRKGISTLHAKAVTGTAWVQPFLDSVPKLYQQKYTEILEHILGLEEDNVEALFLLAKLQAVNGDHNKALKIADRLLRLDPVKACFIQIKIHKYLGLGLEPILEFMKTNLLSRDCSPSLELTSILEELNKGAEKMIYVFDSTSNQVTQSKIPHNFSMVDDKVGGSGMVNNQNIRAIIDSYQFTDVVTLTETPLTLHDQFLQSIRLHFFPIRDRFPPDQLETMNQILEIIESSRKALVHCLGGVGRTNTVLACYLMKFKGMNPSEAISFLDSTRKMILSGEQVNYIKDFYGNLCRERATTEQIANKALPKLIMLVGSPCSGKSTLSEKFLLRYSDVIHVNQDELGKKECVRFFGESLKGDKTIILDRCNGLKTERKEWLEMVQDGSSSTRQRPVCIYFNYPLELLEDRLIRRKVHLTLSGQGGLKILRSRYKALESPTLSEGFSSIITVSDDESYLSLLKSYDIELKTEEEQDVEKQFVKFPRTRHAINLGSASRDDLIMTEGDLQSLIEGTIVIEEKIDGANLGISMSPDGEILIQNRSHYVNEATHPQFKLLRVWLENHREDLTDILDNDKILFGEWVYAKHSIHYTRLPDYFLAYDLYTISTKSFSSRKALDRLLEPTSIKQVPLIAEGKFSKDELIKIAMTTQSKFTDGIVEGIYLRKTVGNVTIARGKVVRVGFICGNDHWTKYKVVRNLLARPEPED